MSVPAAQTSGYAALSPQQQKEHRVSVSVRAEAWLSTFWRDDEPAPVRAMVLEGWADVLCPFTHAEMRQAWATYQIDGPRSRAGTLLRPQPGDIQRIIMAARRKAAQATPRHRPAQEPPRVPASIEQVNSILEEAGYRARRFPKQGEAEG